MLKNEKGFTLVEILMMMAIMAVIAMVALPVYKNYQYRASVNTDISTSAEIIRAARIYSIQNPNTVATITDLLSSGYMTSDTGDTIIPLTSADSFALSYDDASDVYSVVFTTDTSLVGPLYGAQKYDIKENEALPRLK
jgi:prepilin-type N-terminal cleavage/methylation domain-containing protein